MNLVKLIETDYIAAYKAKDNLTLNVLRLLKTAMKNFQVEHKKEPDDADVLDLLSKQYKQRQDSIAQFTHANRLDLAEKENAEFSVLQRYMPVQLQGEKLEAAVKKAIFACGASSARDMGKVMQILLVEYKGQIDGKVASEMVKKALQEM